MTQVVTILWAETSKRTQALSRTEQPTKRTG
eukprot:CAMPEP_0178445214 /NCGR_PEP_ID=MMETSP0689_2-20121128/40017_1 /TAXON_ID=160604 /ORGANISM="Amphidinium massartii, Strain CS-259" /LENGTH=30 /DNA_ID= /DNA_START= /DNA_END= /DNA_ORIENTATION=